MAPRCCKRRETHSHPFLVIQKIMVLKGRAPGEGEIWRKFNTEDDLVLKGRAPGMGRRRGSVFGRLNEFSIYRN